MKNIEELLEVVNEDDKLLGIIKKRGEIHKDDCKEWHRVTAVWILNDKKQILCQKANPKKESRIAKKIYSNFGGHITAGEDCNGSSLKELYEEIGLDIKIDDLIFIGIRKSSSKYRHFVYTYGLIWNGNLQDLNFNDNEVASVRWVNYDELREMEISGMLDNSIPEIVQNFINKY